MTTQMGENHNMVGSVYSNESSPTAARNRGSFKANERTISAILEDTVNIKICQATEATQINHEAEEDENLAETVKEMQTFEVRSGSTQMSRASNGASGVKVYKKQSTSPSKTGSNQMNRSGYGSFKE